MMIKRAELIEKIKAKINERQAQAVESRVQDERDAKQAELEYMRATTEAWSKFATRIRLRMRQGVPITIEDVPEELRHRNYGESYIKIFKPMKASSYSPRINQFQSLLLVLESSPDELISTSALERLGAPVKDLFR